MKFTYAYGVLPHEFTKDFRFGLQVAEDCGTIKASVWEATAIRIADDIVAALRPTFNPNSTTNAGVDDPLTLADFDLIANLRASRTPKEISAFGSGRSTNGELFACEDNFYPVTVIGDDIKNYSLAPAGFESSFALYVGQPNKFKYIDPNLPDERSVDPNLEALGYAMFLNQPRPDLFDGVQWTIQSLKAKFQRPRPFQAVLETNSKGFWHHLSQTAHSPSLPSGHCVETLFGALNAYVGFASNSSSIWQQYRNELAAWSAQVADRRVYAGLHYPSDSFASWICVSHLIPVLFSSGDHSQLARDCLIRSIQASECWTLAQNIRVFAPAIDRLSALNERLT